MSLWGVDGPQPISMSWSLSASEPGVALCVSSEKLLGTSFFTETCTPETNEASSISPIALFPTTLVTTPVLDSSSPSVPFTTPFSSSFMVPSAKQDTLFSVSVSAGIGWLILVVTTFNGEDSFDNSASLPLSVGLVREISSCLLGNSTSLLSWVAVLTSGILSFVVAAVTISLASSSDSIVAVVVMLAVVTFVTISGSILPILAVLSAERLLTPSSSVLVTAVNDAVILLIRLDSEPSSAAVDSILSSSSKSESSDSAPSTGANVLVILTVFVTVLPSSTISWVVNSSTIFFSPGWISSSSSFSSFVIFVTDLLLSSLSPVESSYSWLSICISPFPVPVLKVSDTLSLLIVDVVILDVAMWVGSEPLVVEATIISFVAVTVDCSIPLLCVSSDFTGFSASTSDVTEGDTSSEITMGGMEESYIPLKLLLFSASWSEHTASFVTLVSAKSSFNDFSSVDCCLFSRLPHASSKSFAPVKTNVASCLNSSQAFCVTSSSSVTNVSDDFASLLSSVSADALTTSSSDSWDIPVKPLSSVLLILSDSISDLLSWICSFVSNSSFLGAMRISSTWVEILPSISAIADLLALTRSSNTLASPISCIFEILRSNFLFASSLLGIMLMSCSSLETAAVIGIWIGISAVTILWISSLTMSNSKSCVSSVASVVL